MNTMVAYIKVDISKMIRCGTGSQCIELEVGNDEYNVETIIRYAILNTL